MSFRSQKKSEKNSKLLTYEPFLVEGIAAVSEYLRFRPQAVVSVAATKDRKHLLEKLLSELKSNLAIQNLDSEKPGASIQAMVQLSLGDEVLLKERLQGRTKDVLIALDHITDPRNLGAIARTAAFFGVREMIVPQRRQVLLTQSAVSTAQGGFALCDVICVTNLGRSLEELKEEGYWLIGTDMDGEEISQVSGFYDKIVLILGNEESGLSQLIRKRCDRVVRISGKVPHGFKEGIESLNVSVAAGIFFHGLLR